MRFQHPSSHHFLLCSGSVNSPQYTSLFWRLDVTLVKKGENVLYYLKVQQPWFWHIMNGWFGKTTLTFVFFFSFNRVLFQISITFILWENMRSMCAEFRRAANLTMSLLIKQEVDNYADASKCSWYWVSFRVFIALDLWALHAVLLSDSSAWEVIDGVKTPLCSRSIGATATNRINLRGQRSFCIKGSYLLVTRNWLQLQTEH